MNTAAPHSAGGQGGAPAPPCPHGAPGGADPTKASPGHPHESLELGVAVPVLQRSQQRGCDSPGCGEQGRCSHPSPAQRARRDPASPRFLPRGQQPASLPADAPSTDWPRWSCPLPAPGPGHPQATMVRYILFLLEPSPQPLTASCHPEARLPQAAWAHASPGLPGSQRT